MRGAKAGCVGVVREADDRDLRIGVRDLHGIDPRDVRDVLEPGSSPLAAGNIQNFYATPIRSEKHVIAVKHEILSTIPGGKGICRRAGLESILDQALWSLHDHALPVYLSACVGPNGKCPL